MVTGLETFREYFQNFSGDYIVIGRGPLISPSQKTPSVTEAPPLSRIPPRCGFLERTAEHPRRTLAANSLGRLR